MNERKRLASRVNEIATDLVNGIYDGDAEAANYATHDLRRAAALLAQERELDAWIAKDESEWLDVVCRECGTLTAGRGAGSYVRWVTCPFCRSGTPPTEES